MAGRRFLGIQLLTPQLITANPQLDDYVIIYIYNQIYKQLGI